ncbi:hypothetical protein [Synechococcus sp. MIT S1220]|uniref:hypothetical protein n=1 Tax=Synechococcus sp. MIT S1220 TaxID=3082549 RepID=UPI0039AF716F
MKKFSDAKMLLRLGLLLVGNVLACSFTVWAYPGERPPKGALEAQCQYGENSPQYCKTKIDRANQSFSIWTPPNRQGALLVTYKLDCFRRGCLIIGRDFGYVGGPQKYRLLEFCDRRVKFVSLGDDLNPPVVQMVSILE